MLHTYIHTYRQTDIQTDRHTDRHTEPPTKRVLEEHSLQISDYFKKNYNLIILVDLYVSLSRFVFCCPDPDQRFLKWIRIRHITDFIKFLRLKWPVLVKISDKFTPFQLKFQQLLNSIALSSNWTL